MRSYPNFICLNFIFALIFFAYQPSTSAEPATLIIDKNNYKEFSPQNYFGVFIEYLEDYVNGPAGLYAQEIYDRGFDIGDYNTNIKQEWQKHTIPAENQIPHYEPGGYNQNGVYYAKVISAVDTGYSQFSQKIFYNDTCDYLCYVWARTGKNTDAKAEILIAGVDGKKVYTGVRLRKNISEWTKFEFVIPHGLPEKMLQIMLRVSGTGEADFDEISIMPTNNTFGIRSEWHALMQAIKPTLLRYPGGCFADFRQANFNHAIGQIDQRQSPNLVWTLDFQRMDFGYDEFLSYCEKYNIEPLITLNYLGGNVRLAMEHIRYMTADTNDFWGKLRKKNGHPVPYHVRRFEIGNEQWENAKSYGNGYKIFYDSIKAYNPQFEVIYSGNHWSRYEWLNDSYRAADGKIDVYSYHPALVIDTEYTNPTDSIIKSALGASSLSVSTIGLREDLRQLNPESEIKYTITEWWSHWARWDDWTVDTTAENETLLMGIANGGMLISYLKYAADIKFACRTLGINFIKKYYNCATGDCKIYGELTYQAFKMLRDHVGCRLYSTFETSETSDFYPENKGLFGFEHSPYVESVVTGDTDSLYIAVINRDPHLARDLHINLLQEYKQGKCYQLYDKNILERNSPNDPDKIKVKEFPLPANSGVITLPKHSLTVIALARDSLQDMPEVPMAKMPYPNPVASSGILNVPFPEQGEIKDIEVFTSKGKQYDIKYYFDGQKICLVLQNLPVGTYFCNLIYTKKTAEFVKRFKFVAE